MPASDPRASSYRWVVLAFAILAYATSQVARLNYTGIQRFIAPEFGLSRADLGVLGSVFFYSYALLQMPWGVAADRFGSRWVLGLGILLTAITMAGFATSGSHTALLFWRGAGGVAGAAAYVAITGGLARWFPKHERGMSQSILAGTGGALGEGTAFFLLPALSIAFVSWRYGAATIAGVILVVAVLCVTFMRSAPPAGPEMLKRPFTLDMLADPRLWACTMLHSGCMVAIRISQAWMAVYVTDVYTSTRGTTVNDAVLAGGLLATVGYSIVGRGICVPTLGRVSDALLKRGISRSAIVIVSLAISAIAFQVLSMGVTAVWFLSVIAVVLGTTANSFALAVTEASEIYGAEKTGSVSSFMNMVGQLIGATALAVSGYAGVALNAGGGDSFDEYQGIWMSGVAWIVALAVAGSLLHSVALKDRWASRGAI